MLTDAEIERIAERVAQKMGKQNAKEGARELLNEIYQEVGKGTLRKLVWFTAFIVLSILFWLAGNNHLRIF